MFGETVVRHPFLAGVRNAHGEVRDGWGPDETVEGAAFEPEQSTEPHDEGGARVINPAKLYLRFGQTVTAKDRWTVRGDLYTTEGDPSRWESPYTHRRPGAVIALRKVTG